MGQNEGGRARLVAALAEAIVMAVEVGEIAVAREVHEVLGRVLGNEAAH